MKKKATKKEKVTIDDLATMVQRGFSETASKNELLILKKEVDEFRKETNHRFDVIENIMIRKQGNEIDQLRDFMLQLDVRLAKIEKK